MGAYAFEGIGIESLENNPGLLYERIGNLRLSTITYKIFNKIDMDPLLKAAPKIAQAINITENLCQNPCIYKEEFSHLYNKIQISASELYQITNSITKIKNIRNNDREKRQSVFPWVGKIEHILFGVVDQDSEILLREIASKAYNTSKEVAHLLQNLTEVVHAELGNINEHLGNFSDQIQELKLQQNETQYQLNLANAINNLREASQEFESQVIILIDAINWASSGKIHPKFLSQKQFENSINIIKNSPINAEFPSQRHDFTLSEVVQMSKVIAYVANNNLIYAVYIPLLEYVYMYLYKLHPIPILQNMRNTEVSAYILPSFEFLALEMNNQSYIALDYENLQNCKKIKNTFICKNINPILQVDKTADCEVNILINENLDIENCNIKVKKLTNTYWLKLVRENQWGFSTFYNDSIYIVCEQKAPVTINLPKAGILKLDPMYR